jgi:tRNA1Val (adenine37-N6)-methyltransferase
MNNAIARFQEAMPFEDLIEAAALLLSENGIFSVIIPYKRKEILGPCQ